MLVHCTGDLAAIFRGAFLCSFGWQTKTTSQIGKKVSKEKQVPFTTVLWPEGDERKYWIVDRNLLALATAVLCFLFQEEPNSRMEPIAGSSDKKIPRYHQRKPQIQKQSDLQT